MKYIKNYAKMSGIGGFAAILASGVAGCDGGTTDMNTQEQATTQQQDKKNAFVVIEEVAKGEYKIKEEFPSDEMRIVLKQLDGTERVLSKEEMDKLVKEEEIKIDNNTSNLTKPKSESVSSGGMGLGETILASAAGAMIGAYIGNKLFGNQNYNQNRQTNYKSPSGYSKSANSFGKGAASSASSKSTRGGFFGNSGSSSSSRSGGFFGG